MARIKRSGGTGVRRIAKAQGRAAVARRAQARTTGLVDRAMGLLPFSEQQWSRIWLGLILGGAAALAYAIASLAGLPALAQAEIARIAADAGFEVRQVRVTGTSRMDERQVYVRALAQRDRPMPQVEIEALRAELLELPWVKDARVSIQLPETLVIDIIEREPHAVLEKPDRLMLIDAQGHELEPVNPDAAKDMLHISGPGATRQVAELDTLLAAAPAMGPQVTGAEWVGNRRWNLRFKTGQLLALPEGEIEAASALVKFARLDGQNRLIGGQVLSFDMRTASRIYLRVPGRAEKVQGLAGLEATKASGEAP